MLCKVGKDTDIVENVTVLYILKWYQGEQFIFIPILTCIAPVTKLRRAQPKGWL